MLRITDGTARWLAWGTFISIAAASVVGEAASIPAHSFDPFNLLLSAFPLVGIVILTRQPKNTIGWILLGIGALGAINAALTSYAGYGLRAHQTPLPGATVAAALSVPLWVLFVGIPGIYLLLLFPDGQLLSRRWRAVAWLGAVGIGGTWALIQVTPGSLAEGGFPNLMNPLGIDAIRGVDGLVYAFIALIPISIGAAAVSLVLRF